MNITNELTKKLSNKASLKRIARSMGAESFESVILKMMEVLDVIKQEEAKEKALMLEKELKIKALVARLQSDGIDVNELIAYSSTNKRKNYAGKPRRKVAAKYKFIDEHGEKTWTGRGKQPVWLREKIEAGKKLEDFEI